MPSHGDNWWCLKVAGFRLPLGLEAPLTTELLRQPMQRHFHPWWCPNASGTCAITMKVPVPALGGTTPTEAFSSFVVSRCKRDMDYSRENGNPGGPTKDRVT